MSEHEHGHTVRIHIDGKQHLSASPTTGAALYALGSIVAGMVLYREVQGDREDPAIESGPETVELRQDDHFQSGPPRTYTIYVNGEEKKVTTKTVTFEQLISLAFPTPPAGQNIIYTVSYEDGPPSNPMGSLVTGGKVKVKNGMVFNVTPTDKS